MKTKMIEIRDDGTCIPALVIKMEAANAVEECYMWRTGYPRDGSSIVLMRLSDQETKVDPYEWGTSRTMPLAHNWLCDHFDDIEEEAVLDVRFISGVRDNPVEPEIWTAEKSGVPQSDKV